MDNYPADSAPQQQWAPKTALIAVAGVLALAAAAGAAYAAVRGDRGGLVLFGLAAVVLAVVTGYGALVRPKLAAGEDGVRIRTAAGRVALPWPGLEIRLRTTRRLGRDSVTLEFESGEDLHVLGWLELGEDPRDVLDALSALRAGR
ncbi:PH domain-containing protein [Amycolatopsis minnesotensis]|uniref:Low molecular weight protein antigen 6 PH domain-containing protein n=1 Tax=Amycolatopsis minnesotensis TaxID=337894 RepID=A0ABP5CNZ9_9PSEU